MKKLVNIGCGLVFHEEWINLDLYPASSSVKKCDISNGLPFADNTIDATYSSHVLEHFSPEMGKHFLAEQYRVLKPGGIIRVVVPDLENICTNYLHQLGANNELCEQKGSFRHYYAVLELVDQLSRHKSGGLIMEFWKSCDSEAQKYVVERNGQEAQNVITEKPGNGPNALRRIPFGIKQKLGDLLANAGFTMLSKLKRRDVKECYDLGVFRLSGEVHRFMYDRILLRDSLREAGFSEIRKVDSLASSIPSFETFQLDEINGKKRKPESLYMEAKKVCSTH